MCRVVGKVLADVVIQGDRVPFEQDQNPGGRELLGKGGDPEDHVGFHRHVQLHVGQAVGTSEEDLAVAHRDDGGARLIGFYPRNPNPIAWSPSVLQLPTESGAASGVFQARISKLKGRWSGRTGAPVRTVATKGAA